MRALWFAAGAAAGYLFGTKAGRERYDQIMGQARQLAQQPAVAEARAKLRALVDTGTGAATARLRQAAGRPATDSSNGYPTDSSYRESAGYPKPISTG
jgi:hypothetical protein